jgi:hypothetical protein
VPLSVISVFVRVYPAFLTDYLLHRRMRLSLLRYARSVSSKYLPSTSPGTSVASLAYTASSPASRRKPVRNAGYPWWNALPSTWWGAVAPKKQLLVIFVVRRPCRCRGGGGVLHLTVKPRGTERRDVLS